MPELKHTFAAGKMNKDLDERLVPNGEYRDAMNIQVRTTDGDAAGTVQNLQGNISMGNSYYAEWMGNYDSFGQNLNPTCIASIADEKSDMAYFFFASASLQYNDITSIQQEQLYMDTIIEYEAAGSSVPVFVDMFAIVNTAAEVFGENSVNSIGVVLNETIGNFADLGNLQGYMISEITVVDSSKYRPGMTIEAYGITQLLDDVTGAVISTTQTGNLFLTNVTIKDVQVIDGVHKILFQEPIASNNFEDASHFVFKHDRVLNFKTDKDYHWVTGINIIDNLLFWTDGTTEPKGINISNCKEGTAEDFTSHTKIMVNNPQSNAIASVNEVDNNLGSDPIYIYAKEENITVIKKAPRTAPTLHMKPSVRDNTQNIFITNQFINNTDDISLSTTEEEIIVDDALLNSNFRKDDILIITQTLGLDANGNVIEVGIPIVIKAKFVSYLNDDGEEILEVSNSIKVMIFSVSNSTALTSAIENWKIDAELKKPIFERKMVRFGYRYKYENGEYSSFSPWSELAFLPSNFDYSSKEAYNLGMVNNVRELIIKDFIPYKRPAQVKEIDILYKATDSANVYVAATVTRTKSDEWELFTPDGIETIDGGSGEINTGQLTVTSEMVHRALPSTQLLRGWDNVPRKALAQEITGNRLVFGNYTQGYNINTDINLLQEVISDQPINFPHKSIKSIRDYKIGMVFGDKYGRETPVITPGYSIEEKPGVFDVTTGDISVEKTLCAMQNRFKLTMDWDNPPNWVKDGGYVKYYVKETSNEYYNLVQDRWYDSGDGTIWLSFNSADRNKVDEETYLLLKNKNGSNDPVLEKARYKIISIKNEAPDYIKTTYNTLGDINITQIADEDSGAITSVTQDTIWLNGGSVGAEQPEGFWSEDRVIKINLDVWNDSDVGQTQPNNNEIFGREIKGDIEMQVIGEFNGLKNYSSWRRVVHYTRGSDGTDQWIVLKWNEVFSGNVTGGANMYQAFNCTESSIDCSTLVYKVRLREAIVENKPEFDGKFFVKIAKDDMLHANVIGLGAFNYEAIGTFNLSYIESSTKNQSSLTMSESITPEANFNDSGGDTDANNWFYGEFAGFVNLSDGTTDSNETFGLARWNVDNGEGNHSLSFNIESGAGENTLINSGQHVYKNVSGTSMGALPLADSDLGLQQPGWHVWNGSNWDTPHYYYDWIVNVGASNDTTEQLGAGMNGEPLSGDLGFPYPNSWNFNYYATPNPSFFDGVTQEESWGGIGKVGNRQYPVWWGHNEEQSSPLTGELEQGPSIMGQLCGPSGLDYDLAGIPVDTGTQVIAESMSNDAVTGYRESTMRFWRSYSDNNGGLFLDGAGARRAFGGPFGQGDRIYPSIPEAAWDGLPNNSYQVYQNDNWGGGTPNNPLEPGGEPLKEPGFVDFYKFNSMDKGVCDENGNILGEEYGGTQDGSIGRMYISYLLANEAAVIGAINQLTAGGAMFSFQNAPLNSDGKQNIYRVVYADRPYAVFNYSALHIAGAIQTGMAEYGLPENMLGWNCVPCAYGGPATNNITQLLTAHEGVEEEIVSISTGSIMEGSPGYLSPEGRGCVRITRAIEFRLVNQSNNETLPTGIPITGDDAYDPRSWLWHDGRNSLELQFIGYGSEVDIGGNSVNNHLGACWETEPKESVDVDLYYEATNALPMVLDSQNTFDYIPVNSKVSATRQTNSDIASVILSDSDHKVNNIHFFKDTSIISIVKRANIDSDWELHKENLRVGDVLSFTHNDGTKTSTKILSHCLPIHDVDGNDPNPTMHGPLNEVEQTLGVVDNPRSFVRASVFDEPLVLTTFTINGYYYVAIPDSIDTSFVIGATVLSVSQTLFNNLNVTVTPPSATIITNVYSLAALPSGYNAVSFTYNNNLFTDNAGPFITANNASIAGEDYDALNQILINANGENIFVELENRTGYYEVDSNVWKYPVELPWYNCYSFGNGVESDRVRDDFNAPQIDNGNRVSTTFSGYGEENKSSGMIYSGLYNSTSEVNNLNEFNTSEKITKDLNPSYGSIQRLKTRDTDIVVLAEDKILKVLSNKDAVYNADGNPQLTATNRVLGQAVPFVGDFGISKNPESLAWDQFRLYFTDTQRGAVLRLSRDGLTPISSVGMKTWFRDNIAKARPSRLLGTYDVVNGEYNLTMTYSSNFGNIDNKTISFNEASKGWVSFKSFIPSDGVSVSGKYITVDGAYIYEHYMPEYEESGQCAYDNCVERNRFYNQDLTSITSSSIEILFNESPGTVKSFKTINYEGSQARVTQLTTSTVTDAAGNVVSSVLQKGDGQYYNLSAVNGWWASNVNTDLQEGDDIEFKDKENKWFSSFKGDVLGTSTALASGNTTVSLSELDTNEFSIQGLGNLSSVGVPLLLLDCEEGFVLNGEDCVPIVEVLGCTDPNAFNYNVEANTDDGSCCFVSGCMDPSALNWNPNACQDDGSCIEIIAGCQDLTSGLFPDINGNNIYGDPCTYPCGIDQGDNIPMIPVGYFFDNYNPQANTSGPCTEGVAPEPDPDTLITYACQDPYAINYDPSGINDENVLNCYDLSALDYEALTAGCCEYNVAQFVCTDDGLQDFSQNPGIAANNYQAIGTIVEGTSYYAAFPCKPEPVLGYPICCDYTPPEVFGCMDVSALNFNFNANVDDGSCIYEDTSGLATIQIINQESDSNAQILWDELGEPNLGYLDEDGDGIVD